MLLYPLALTIFLSGSANAIPRSTKQQLISVMKSRSLDPKIMASAAKTSRSITKSITEEAIIVPAGRKLEEAAANYNNAAYYNQNYVEGTDDFYSFGRDVDWENLWGFDASQYSLSYERCATVKHFDVEKAAEEDATSPFRTQHFAVLRLCPAKTCDSPDWYMNDDNVDDDAEEGEEGEEEAEEQQDDADEYAEVYGANGRGCTSNYATFLLDAGKYMSLMADYEDTQFEMYCDYCERYMQEQYQKWVQNGGHRELKFEEFKNSEEIHRQLGGDMGACSVYANACAKGFQDDYADLLECAEVQKDNGMVAYTQATCAEDGQTITIGLYSDDECSEDITSQVNMANWLGSEVDDEEMSHYYKQVATAVGTLIESYGGQTNVDANALCMPCAAQDQAWFQSDDDDTTSGGTEIAEICDTVFMEAARCDKTLSNWWRRKRNANYQESVALQDISCEYIDNMRMGKYDTEGNVIMDANRLYNEDGDQGINGNLYMQEYGQAISEVSPFQIFLLVASISACALLGVWSTSLHKSLTKGGLNWKPKKQEADDVEVSRQASGIVMGRSQSNNTSYYMS